MFYLALVYSSLVTALPAVDFTDVQAASIAVLSPDGKPTVEKIYYYKNGKNDRSGTKSVSIITVCRRRYYALQGGTVFIIVSGILANRPEECVSIRL